MTPEKLRRMMSYLEERVELGDGPTIRFELPGEDEMIASGNDAEGVRRLLAAPWLAEMVEEVRETPEFCEPGDPPEQVLRYARDVIQEYIRKRFELAPDEG
jgi:hypothetical protein